MWGPLGRGMDAIRHTPARRRARLGLLGAGLVIVLVGLRGPAIVNDLGIFQRLGASSRSARPADVPPMSQPVTVLVERRLQLMDAQLQAPQPTPPSAPPASLYTAQGLRDPLESLFPPEPPPATMAAEPNPQPTYQPPSSPPSLTVQGLLWGMSAPKAIINGQVCKVGDTVSGATITSITRHGIEVEFQGATYLTTVKGTMTMLSQGAQGR